MSRKNWKKTLKTNYAQVLFVCAAFVLLVVVGSFSVGNVIRKESLKAVNVALSESEKTIHAYLHEPKIAFYNIYTAISAMLDMGESQEALHSYLTQTADVLMNQEDGISGLTAVYGYIRSELLLGVDADLGDDYIPQQRPWYQLAIRSEGAEYTAPYVDANTGFVILSLVQQIYGADGEYYGVLGMDIDISWLMDYSESLQFAEGGYGIIVNQFLYTIAHPQELYRNVPMQELEGGYGQIADMLRTGQDVSGEIIRDTDGTQVIVFFKGLYNDWFIGIVMPTSSYNSDLYTTILLLASLGIVLALILSYILLRLSAAKMAADEESRQKSSFLARVSHEIRTPLNAIIGLAQIKLQEDNLPAEHSASYEKIYSFGADLLGVINDILDMSKIDTGKMELNLAAYDTPSLINDSVQLNVVRIGSKPINFILDVDESLPSKLIGDELRLKQILNNLLSNAIKYTEKGFVKLSVSHTPRGEDVLLRFAVEDTGCGMKPEDRERVFTEYLRFDNETNRTIEGTGLGLPIAKMFVELMDGTIEAKSEYGKGSVFTATVCQRAVECDNIGFKTANHLRRFVYSDGRKSALQITRHPMPYGKVLIVDDVEANLYVAEGLMSPYEIKIEAAQSGFEAIDYVKNGNVYDVIFMDHMMPQMDGIETTRKLRSLGYTGAIVALTANALAGNDEMFEMHGFDDFLSKPIDIRQLNSVLNKFVRDQHPDEAEKYAPLSGVAAGEALVRDGQAEAQGPDPKLIEVFIRSAKKAVATLRAAAADGDIKLIAITAHAMKSALLNIGEQDASEAAFALEKAGLDGDADFIAANLDGFIESLEGLCERLGLQVAGVPESDPALCRGAACCAREGGPARPGDLSLQNDVGIAPALVGDAPLRVPQLQILKSACEAYDDEAAFAALDLLKDAPLGADTAAALEEIHDMLFLDSDFDAAAERTEELLKS